MISRVSISKQARRSGCRSLKPMRIGFKDDSALLLLHTRNIHGTRGLPAGIHSGINVVAGTVHGEGFFQDARGCFCELVILQFLFRGVGHIGDVAGGLGDSRKFARKDNRRLRSDTWGPMQRRHRSPTRLETRGQTPQSIPKRELPIPFPPEVHEQLPVARIRPVPGCHRGWTIGHAEVRCPGESTTRGHFQSRPRQRPQRGGLDILWP